MVIFVLAWFWNDQRILWLSFPLRPRLLYDLALRGRGREGRPLRGCSGCPFGCWAGTHRCTKTTWRVRKPSESPYLSDSTELKLAILY